MSQQLLTCALSNWNRQTCIQLAFSGKNSSLLAHPCSQTILADLWMGGLRIRHRINLKVVSSIFLPLLIGTLDFKTKEELELMPKNEEKFVIDPKESVDGQENSLGLSWNGKVQTKHEDIEENASAPMEHLSREDLTERNFTELGILAKLQQFYVAPITKFWFHSIFYILFLLLYTYTALVKLHDNPNWNESYVIIYILTFGIELLREIVIAEPVRVKHKIYVWFCSWWNCCDAIAVVWFGIAMTLRLDPSTFSTGRALYSLNVVYW